MKQLFAISGQTPFAAIDGLAPSPDIVMALGRIRYASSDRGKISATCPAPN